MVLRNEGEFLTASTFTYLVLLYSFICSSTPRLLFELNFCLFEDMVCLSQLRSKLGVLNLSKLHQIVTQSSKVITPLFCSKLTINWSLRQFMNRLVGVGLNKVLQKNPNRL